MILDAILIDKIICRYICYNVPWTKRHRAAITFHNIILMIRKNIDIREHWKTRLCFDNEMWNSRRSQIQLTKHADREREFGISRKVRSIVFRTNPNLHVQFLIPWTKTGQKPVSTIYYTRVCSNFEEPNLNQTMKSWELFPLK